MSYTSLNYHIVFSTKQRKPLLLPDTLPRVCQYMGGLIREMDGCLLLGNGHVDHVHLAAVIPATAALADFVGKLKANTTKWIHRTFRELRSFTWQEGYAAFTVSLSALERVKAYIRSREQHHREMTFEEELIALLDRHGVEYDRRYLLG